jgi:hypothetical protein
MFVSDLGQSHFVQRIFVVVIYLFQVNYLLLPITFDISRSETALHSKLLTTFEVQLMKSKAKGGAQELISQVKAMILMNSCQP